MDVKKIALIAGIIIALVTIGIVVYTNPFKETPSEPVVLEFWSVFDGSDVYAPLITKFQQQNSFITISYHKKNITTYETELIDALAAGRGPDVFSVHNTWAPKHKDKLYPAPVDLITPKRFQEVFVDVAAQDFIVGDKIAALPLSVDTLALFYNKDLLNSAGIATPPQTWSEFNSAVEKLTQRDAKNNILQAGATLGTARNINRSTDILAALMLQSGAKMVRDDKKSAAFDQPIILSSGESFNPGQQALIYYTSFANPAKKVYTWNQFQHYSIDMFVGGQAAMMLNYSYQIPTIRARAPHLNFAVAPLPQISKTGPVMTFANYWGQAVSKTSKNAAYAWQFLAFLTNQENAKQYLEKAKKPTARKDLINWQKEDLDLGTFALQTLSAKSWWEADNLAIENILAEMIEKTVARPATAAENLRTASQQVTLLMREGQ